nr:pheromone receptor transcription factor-like [Dermatophagoides farinae]
METKHSTCNDNVNDDDVDDHDHDDDDDDTSNNNVQQQHQQQNYNIQTFANFLQTHSDLLVNVMNQTQTVKSLIKLYRNENWTKDHNNHQQQQQYSTSSSSSSLTFYLQTYLDQLEQTKWRFERMVPIQSNQSIIQQQQQQQQQKMYQILLIM